MRKFDSLAEDPRGLDSNEESFVPLDNSLQDLVEKSFIRGYPARVMTRELIQFAQNSMTGEFHSYSSTWMNGDSSVKVG